MKQKKQWMGFALGLMLLGTIGLVATQYALADLTVEGDDGVGYVEYDEEDAEYDAYDEEDAEYDAYDEDDAGCEGSEEAIYGQIDLLYDENEDAFSDLEESLGALYESLDSAVEFGSDSEIASLIKQIYAKENELEALEEESGIAELYGEIDALREAEDESDEERYADEDEQVFAEGEYAQEDESEYEEEFDEEEQ